MTLIIFLGLKMSKENDYNLILKLNHAPCLKCKKYFKDSDEIVMTKNSIMHKECFDDLKRMFEKENV